MRHLYHKKSCLVFVILLFFAACPAGVQARADGETAPGNISAQSEKKIKIQPAKPAERLLTGEEVEKKVEEYNRAAVDLFERGKYSQSQELWKKAIGLMENPGARYVDVGGPQEDQTASGEPGAASVRPSLAGEDSDLDQKYETGMWLLERKEYAKARKIFEEIQGMRPGYKNTANYLTVIGELTQGGQTPETEPVVIPEDESRSEGPVSIEGEGQSSVEEEGSGKEETQREEAADQAEQKRLEELEQKVAPIYAQAVEHYEQGELAEAKISFNQVEALYPDYELTGDYLAHIDDDIREAEERRVRQEKEASVKEREQFQKAVRARQMAYRRQQDAEAEKFYQQAVEAYKNRRFDEAENNFRKVSVLSAGYKLTAKYLERIKQDRLEEGRLHQEQQRQLAVLEQSCRQAFDDGAESSANAAVSPDALAGDASTEGAIVETPQPVVQPVVGQPAEEKTRISATVPGTSVPEVPGTEVPGTEVPGRESKEIIVAPTAQPPAAREGTKEHLRVAREQQREKKIRDREQARQDQKKSREFKQTVARKYREVVAAYKNKQWEAAAQKLGDFESFLSVEDSDGLYQKSYAARVSRLRKNIQTQQAGARAPRPELKEALVKPLPPGPPVSLGLLESKGLAPSDDPQALRRQQQQIRKERQKIHSAIDIRIGRSYARAVDLYDKGYYQQAGELFEAIDRASPAFKKTRNYLAGINSKLATAPSAGTRASGGVIVTSPIYVRPRGQIVSDILDSLEVQPH